MFILFTEQLRTPITDSVMQRVCCPFLAEDKVGQLRKMFAHLPASTLGPVHSLSITRAVSVASKKIKQKTKFNKFI